MSMKVVLLGTDGQSTRAIFHALRESGYEVHLVIETPQSRAALVRRRVSRLGLSVVIGQLLFQLFVMPVLAITSSRRMREIVRQYGLKLDAVPFTEYEMVHSANSSECIDLVRSKSPDIVLLSGTRILTADTLKSMGCTVINIHAGITPRYRGVHGAYWALAENNPDHCGVTLHLVDAGIDTGDVLAQRLICPGIHDNFTTYPLIQTAAGIELMLPLLPEIISGRIKGKKIAGKSKLWYHPTIWQYFANRIRRGVR